MHTFVGKLFKDVNSSNKLLEHSNSKNEVSLNGDNEPHLSRAQSLGAINEQLSENEHSYLNQIAEGAKGQSKIKERVALTPNNDKNNINDKRGRP